MEIGLYFLKMDSSVDLNTGSTRAIFSLSGKTPDCNDKLKYNKGSFE